MAMYFGYNYHAPEAPTPPPGCASRLSKEKEDKVKYKLTDDEKRELKTNLLSLVKRLTSVKCFDSEEVKILPDIVNLLLEKFS